MKLGTIVERHVAASRPSGEDVIAKAQELGWIESFGYGQYIYRAPWTSLFRTLQGLVLSRAKNLGYEEWIFPRVIPNRSLDSFKLSQFREELLVRVPSWDSALDPVQCIGLYESLRDSRLRESDLPIKIVECLGGWTWRAEPDAFLNGPIKTREFARVEHVYVGSPDQVVAIRERTREALTSLIAELGMSYQVVVGEGCMEIPELVEALETADSAESLPVQDIEIPLQSRSNPADPAVVQRGALLDEFDPREICGCSVEGVHLARDFGISSDSGESVWTGCCGMGMNRLVVGFLFQHGFDMESWPSSITKAS